MAIKGRVRARCLKGCEPWDAEQWSFINGSVDASLRESLLGGELNLVSCPECGTLFYPDSTVVYLDSGSDLLAFVLPESYRQDEIRWRRKMDEDYAQMKALFSEGNETTPEPTVLFGMENLRRILERDDELQDEVQVAEALMRQLGLSSFAVSRAFARAHDLPWLLPYRGVSASPASIIESLKILLKANDRLVAFQPWFDLLSKSGALPSHGRGRRS